MTEAYAFEVKKTLKQKLRRIRKKDTPFFEAVKRKMAQVIEHPTHYKPLRSNLKGVRRVHVK
ncbi:MAG TPA: hypothetical protein ENH13_05335, partial [Euryarchaeota archaeon]|nr:hypothetical protein [Euryarchaeota archaeon]